MRKEEILSKSRKENFFGDERKEYLENKSFLWASVFLSFMYIFLYIISKIKGFDYSIAHILFGSFFVGKYLYNIIFRKNDYIKLELIGHYFMFLGFSILTITSLIEIVFRW